MAKGTLDQHQDSEGTNFGHGQFAGVRYRGQNFTPALTGSLGTLGFSRTASSQGVDWKIYIGATSSHLPPALGSELYSFIIGQAAQANGYGEYDLPIPLPLTVGVEYCFYIAPFLFGSYSDDYLDNHGIGSAPAGLEDTNNNGVWANENLTFHFATYMIPPAARTLAVGRTKATSRKKATGRKLAVGRTLA